MATALYQRVIAFDYGDAERSQIMQEVWLPTPWMIEVYTGRSGEVRQYDIVRWCRETLGPESSPIHKIIGTWHRGGATVNGWTWFGFATEADMQRFQEAWPAPEGVARPDAWSSRR